MITFGFNRSVKGFEEFRQSHGPRVCYLSDHRCYRHNLTATSLFISQFLRNPQSPIEPLLDFMEMEMLAERSNFRPAAKDCAEKILKIAKKLDYFSKGEML
jgi:hypothetical protein